MKRFSALPETFYEPSARVVAPRLLGHWLVRRTPEGLAGGPIVETEAYLSDDPACHAARGLTARNRAMFGPPGRAYVYFIYGCHFCVNAVCRPSGVAEAVLIRAIEPGAGEPLMRRRRTASRIADLANGPARLCQALGINRELDGADLCDARSSLFIAANPELEAFLEARSPVVTTARVGITRAADLPLRFYLEGSPGVSRRAVASRQGRALSPCDGGVASV